MTETKRGLQNVKKETKELYPASFAIVNISNVGVMSKSTFLDAGVLYLPTFMLLRVAFTITSYKSCWPVIASISKCPEFYYHGRTEQFTQ